MFISSSFVLAKPKKEKEIISFRFAKHNMSSKIVGWLVGARDGKILELRIKSGINKKIWNKSSFTCSYVFQNFSGISWFLQNSRISFIVMANTIFLPHRQTDRQADRQTDSFRQFYIIVLGICLPI